MSQENPAVPSPYKSERAKYKALFPKCKTHHMHPHERRGDDTEFNLFPWNTESHAAWHRVFHNLTTREVWSVLSSAYRLVWHAGVVETKPAWRWEYRTLFEGTGQRREYSAVRGAGFWQERWTAAFGSGSFDAARTLVRAMMMTMAFGHWAYTLETEDLGALARAIRSIPPGTDRAWAFETCFRRPLTTHQLMSVRRQVRELVRLTAAARP